MPSKKDNHLVIIGANVAGLALCKGLASVGIRATVVDPVARFEWLPNIHEMLSSDKSSGLLSFDKVSLLKKMRHRYINSRLSNVDFPLKQLQLENGQVLQYEKIIFAMGGVNQSLGVKNVEQFAYTFKSLHDAEIIQKKYSQLLNREDTKKQENVVIVGGGVEGIEVLGELLKLKPCSRNIKITLVNSRNSLFADYGNLIHKRVTRKSRGEVNFIHGTKVKKITNNSVVLDNDDHIESQLVIWTGGVAPSSFLKKWQLTQTDEEWIPVDQYLRHKTLANVYAIGDCVDFGKGLFKQASIAIDMGSQLAQNLYQEKNGKAPKPYKPLSKPMLITFGNRDAYLISRKDVFASSGLLPLKELIYQAGMFDLGKGDGLKALAASLRRASPLLRPGFTRRLLTAYIGALSDSAISLKGFRSSSQINNTSG